MSYYTTQNLNHLFCDNPRGKLLCLFCLRAIMRYADGFILANLSELNIYFVSGVPGTWHVTKSALSRRVFKSVTIMPVSLMNSRLIGYGSYPIKFMRSAFAILPMLRPMFPTPTIPRYFPDNCVPIRSFLIQLPRFVSASALGILLAS